MMDEPAWQQLPRPYKAGQVGLCTPLKGRWAGQRRHCQPIVAWAPNRSFQGVTRLVEPEVVLKMDEPGRVPNSSFQGRIRLGRWRCIEQKWQRKFWNPHEMDEPDCRTAASKVWQGWAGRTLVAHLRSQAPPNASRRRRIYHILSLFHWVSPF